MMEDLLDFKTFKETLGNNGFRDIKVSENSIFCKAIICEHTIGLKGVLPETFPYEFPTIYIDEQSYANISPLPHIGSDFDICTFDKSTVIPNFKSPTQLLLASFVKAREIIRQGIAKENIEDFAEEFCSYWIIDCDSAAESILTLPDKPTTICAYYSRQTKKVYLSNRKKELDHYLGNNYLWKMWLFQKLLKVPDLNGKWEGGYESIREVDGKPIQTTGTMVLSITQTWNKMACQSSFSKSESYSDVIYLDIDGPQGVVLKFTYTNKSHDVTCNLAEFSGYNEL